MSTIAYAVLTTRRERSKPGTSSGESPPGVTRWVDMMAALVPAEILTFHGLILVATTKTGTDTEGVTR